jgi:hypothetical protein
MFYSLVFIYRYQTKLYLFLNQLESACQEFCNEVELSEYCRRKGLYPEPIRAWRKACQQAKEIKQLQDELRRKDKALAETAALLVLQK